MTEAAVVGWDIGGAHLKAALLRGGRLVDAAQWPCPLWRGLDHLGAALDAARSRWPALATMAHAVTMTGEMVDLFAHREEGVARIAAALAAALPLPRFYAGDLGWCDAAGAASVWRGIASANWLATATHAALAFERGEGLLVDIGSTTTDLIAFRGGRVLTTARSDADRLAGGDLIYRGVVRTPLCAVAPTIEWRGAPLNVMAEFFASSADLFRLTGELDPAHDQHASADGAAKDLPHSRARLARMIGLDERDADAAAWAALAQAWRTAFIAPLRAGIERIAAAQALGTGAIAVAAGCGAFLVPGLLPAGWRAVDYGRELVRLARDATPGAAAWAGVGAAAVATAALYDREHR